MSVNRLLKKRQQEAHGANELNNVENPNAHQYLPDASKVTKEDIKLEEELEKFADYTQYNPSEYSFSNTHMPYNLSLYNHFKLPLTVFLPPVSYDMDPVEKSIDKIPRCASCRAYMNYYNEIKKNSFVCFICGRENSFMGGNYQIDAESVETSHPSYHVLGGENVYLQSPPENAFIFMVDLNSSAAQSKMLYYFVSVVKEVLAREEFDETQIYFYTYDDVLHEYDFTGEEVKCTVFDPTINDSGSRVQENFLSNIREKLFLLLDSLEEMAEENKKQSSNFYQSYAYVFQAIKHTGGKMFIFQANEAISGEHFTNEHVKNPNNEVEMRPRSFLETRNKLFFNTYVSEAIQTGISVSFFIFEKNYKNVRVLGDFAKLSGSDLLVYRKDSPEDLNKFYYDFSYLLSCTYYKSVIMDIIICPGWYVSAVYGNLYRIKEFIGFKVSHVEPSKKVNILIFPTENIQLPYFSMQVITNYIYNRQHFACVNTVVLPLTTSLEKLYSNQDYALSSASLSRAALSVLRLEEINVLRNKFIRNVATIWKCASDFYKKKVTPEINNLILSQLGVLKSQHFQLDGINDSQALDVVVYQRNILQSCGVNEIQNFFCPYLFNLSSMSEEMCGDEENFIYPDVCELKFNSVKDGMFLLDNGFSLYLYIAKTCNPNLLRMLYGKEKLGKHENLGEECFLSNNHFAQQVKNLIQILREQKSWGWIPLYVVRCGDGTFYEKTFYMNFYAEKYDEFRGCKYTLGEFIQAISEQF